MLAQIFHQAERDTLLIENDSWHILTPESCTAIIFRSTDSCRPNLYWAVTEWTSHRLEFVPFKKINKSYSPKVSTIFMKGADGQCLSYQTSSKLDLSFTTQPAPSHTVHFQNTPLLLTFSTITLNSLTTGLLLCIYSTSALVFINQVPEKLCGSACTTV